MSVAENRLSLGRRHCAEQRRYLAGLQSLAQRLRADEQRLWAELQSASPPVAATTPAAQLAESLVERHQKLTRSVAEIDAQIAQVGAALSVAEQELKRHELASAQHIANTAVSEPRRGRRPSPRPAGSGLAGSCNRRPA